MGLSWPHAGRRGLQRTCWFGEIDVLSESGDQSKEAVALHSSWLGCCSDLPVLMW
jgi:hypothetical protein